MRKVSAVKLLGAAVLLGALIFFSGSPVFKILRETLIGGLKPLMRLTRSSSTTSEPPELSLYQDKIKVLTFEEQKLREENNRLRRALDFKTESRLSMRGANVLLYLREFGKEYLLIDTGTENGIKKGDWVIDYERILVGMVAETGNGFSKVSIASSPGSVFEAEIVPGNTSILSRGLGGRSFSLELIPQNAPIRKGDFVVAKPFYLLLGEIVDIKDNQNSLLKEARAVLLARPEILNEVFVVRREPGI